LIKTRKPISQEPSRRRGAIVVRHTSRLSALA
jgi:hypothetical protein